MAWLRRLHYDAASLDQQRNMRKAALVPDMAAEMPEVYRLWRTCKQNNSLFWQGNIADQPHVLMLEFTVCENAYNAFQQELENTARILRGMTGGAQ